MKYAKEFGYASMLIHMLPILINYMVIHHTLTYWGIILSMINPVHITYSPTYPSVETGPSGIFLPGTEFSMGSRSRRYRRSLRRHRRFLRSHRRYLRSYRRSLRRCWDPWGDDRDPDATTPIVSRLAKHHKTLSNIVKHNTCKTLWYIVKHREPLVKHHETLLKHCETS